LRILREHRRLGRAPRLALARAQLALRLVDRGDVAQVDVEPLDPIELVVEVRKLGLGLLAPVLQIEVLGPQQRVLRDLADHVEVVGEHRHEADQHQRGRDPGAHQHAVLDADLANLGVSIRDQQDRVRPVQSASDAWWTTVDRPL